MLDIWARSLLGRYVPGTVLMVVGRVVLGVELDLGHIFSHPTVESLSAFH